MVFRSIRRFLTSSTSGGSNPTSSFPLLLICGDARLPHSKGLGDHGLGAAGPREAGRVPSEESAFVMEATGITLDGPSRGSAIGCLQYELGDPLEGDAENLAGVPHSHARVDQRPGRVPGGLQCGGLNLVGQPPSRERPLE